MNHNQVQQEISIIKEMIEKTRRETAESGHFFIIVGILSIISTIVIGFLEINRLNHFVLPTLIIFVVIMVIAGFIIGYKDEKKEKVKTYAKTIFGNLWLACGIPGLMVLFLFPLLKVYPWQLVPVLASLIMGIGLFTTGAIYDLRFIQWCSVAWWVGAFMMAILEGHRFPKLSIMITCLIIGFILPGYILNKKYKNRSKENGS